MTNSIKYFSATILLLLSITIANAAPGYLGVHMELKENSVVFNKVLKGSPAGKAGLEDEDIITHVAGVKVNTLAEFKAQVSKLSSGEKLTLTILRDKNKLEKTITLGQRPKPSKAKMQGLIDKPAPELDHIKQWVNLPKGKESINLADYKGKTVYLYCFQSWCPGCHSNGFPTMKSLIDHYKNDDSVIFLAAQTVFEGYQTNTFENGQKVLKKFNLTIPMGQDGAENQRSGIMKNYATRGTPWTIIINPEGIIRYSSFHIEKKAAVLLIDEFKKK